MAGEEDRYSFYVEYYDPQPAMVKTYTFSINIKDCSIDMYDVKSRKPFLKRAKVDGLRLSDLYLGSTINVFGRQLKIVDYLDDYTRRKLSTKSEKTLGIIKPAAISKIGSILDIISESGFMIVRMKMCVLSRSEALTFYKEHEGKPFIENLLAMMTSGPVVAVELMGMNAITAWRDLMGPTDPTKAREAAPLSIRARYGTDNTNNAVHGSDSPESAEREISFFFAESGSPRQGTAKLTNCTLGLIKPHAVQTGMTGKIISAVLDAGFEISAIEMFYLDSANAEEFLEVYKGVVGEYSAMVRELTSGPCVAIEVRSSTPDTQKNFREFVGPMDPEIARHLRPRTLRAQFGNDKIQNALHCTDLPEDAILETQYFFQILSE